MVINMECCDIDKMVERLHELNNELRNYTVNKSIDSGNNIYSSNELLSNEKVMLMIVRKDDYESLLKTAMMLEQEYSLPGGYISGRVDKLKYILKNCFYEFGEYSV